MQLKWSIRRQLLYYVVFGVIGLIALWAGYYAFFTAPPTCQDGRQNGQERGVDCGGACALVCANDARLPATLWSPRIFQTGPSTFTSAMYVRNNNIGAGAKGLGYRLQLFDAKNLLVVSLEKTIDIPPVQTVPIVDTGINVGNHLPTHAVFEFTSDSGWYKVGGLPALRIGNQFLAADGSKLSATVYNDSADDASKVTVVAVLFDSSGTAIAASKSLIARIPHRESQGVTFTFGNGVPGVMRAEITVLPSF